MITKEYWNNYVYKMKKAGFDSNGVSFFCTKRQQQQNIAMIKIGRLHALPDMQHAEMQLKKYREDMKEWQKYFSESQAAQNLPYSILDCDQENIMEYGLMLREYNKFISSYECFLRSIYFGQYDFDSYKKENEATMEKAKDLFEQILSASPTKELLSETDADLSFYVQECPHDSSSGRLIYAKLSFKNDEM